MAIAPISVGDTSARAKMNQAIAKANEVDGKASTGQLMAEAAARRAEILALPLPMPVQHRPGDAPLEFGRSLAEGEPASIAPVPDSLLRYDEAGKVVRLTGDDILAPRHLYALEPGRRYLAIFAVQRRVNSPDPDNDAIRCGLAWYGQGKSRLAGGSAETIVQDLLGLTTGSGRQVVRAVVSRAAGDGIDIVAPAGARYVRPYVQTFGTLVQNDVEVISWADITDAVAFAPDVSALEDRIAEQESLDAGDRLDVLEAASTAPNALRLKTVGDLEAATVPVSADVVELLGYTDPGDRGGARYKRVALEPAHPAKEQSDDGAWWEIAEPVLRSSHVGDDVQAALDAALVLGRDAEVDGAVSGSGIEVNYNDTRLSGSAQVSKITATASGPVIKSLLADRPSPISIEGVVLRDFAIDGDDTATVGLDLERLTRRCVLDGLLVENIVGDGISIVDSWSYSVRSAQVRKAAGIGLRLGSSLAENNAMLVAGAHIGQSGGVGLSLEGGQGGAIIGSTSEYNVEANMVLSGSNRVVIGNYAEGHDPAAYPSGQKYCVVMGDDSRPCIDTLFWNYVNGGSVTGESFAGDGVLLKNVCDTFFKATFSISTRHEYVWDEVGRCVGNVIWLNSDAYTGTTSTSAIRNITSGISGDATILKGANCYNNTTRNSSASLGLRETHQIRPNGTTGSVFEYRVAWDGSARWRWGKLSSTQDEFNIADGSGTRIRVTGTAFHAVAAYSSTTADAANVNVASDGQLRRSTSSARYKRDVEDIDPALSLKLLDELRPVYYRSRCDGDNPGWSYWGLIAEEVAKIDPRLVSWRTQELVTREEEIEVSPAKIETIPAVVDEAGIEISPERTAVVADRVVELQRVEEWRDLQNPVAEGVYYDRIVPHLLMVANHSQAKIEGLRAESADLRRTVAALLSRVEALEAKAPPSDGEQVK